MAGIGTKFGSTSSNDTEPNMLMAAEKAKPGKDRSIRYHNTGFANARVKATCSVDCQGSRRYIRQPEPVRLMRRLNLTTANAMPTKTPILRTAEYHIGPRPLSVEEGGLAACV